MLTVALHGTSLALSALGAALRERIEADVVAIDARRPNAVRCLAALTPDVVVFDLDALPPDLLALWKGNEHILLIGLDMGTQRALVLSGAPASAVTVDDPVSLIERHTRCHEASSLVSTGDVPP